MSETKKQLTPEELAEKAIKDAKEEAKKQKWIAIANLVGYEGAAVLVRVLGLDGVIRVLVSLSYNEKKKVWEAEIQGGKPEDVDGGNPKQTARREINEEAGLELSEDDLIEMLQTVGGTTGVRSVQFISKVFKEGELKPTKKEKFEKFVASKFYFDRSKPEKEQWFIKSEGKDILVRNFNCYFLKQNFERLEELGLVEEVSA